MKLAQEIPSVITTPADAAITEREDETTETTPLHPRQLQQFLQQLNWQEQDLTAAGISSTLLTEEFNRSWYSRLNYWFLREPFLFKILQWPFSKKWPIGSVFPTNNERLLKQIYGVNGYLEGVDLMLNKVWSSLLLSFLIVDIYNYNRYPDLRVGNTLLQIFLAQTDNQQILSNVLTLPEAWPILLGSPILWGVLKALLSAQHAKAVNKNAYRTLLETLGHYQPSLWKDIGRWVLPSLLPEFVPNLALFALLPEPKLKLALENAERLLLWDRRISPGDRRILLQQVQVLAHKATYITQLKASLTLTKVADGIALNDLARLSRQGVDAETLKSLLWVKQQAKQTLQQIAQAPLVQSLLLSPTEIEPSLTGDKLATPSRSRYLYTHYLLWTSGQPHDYRLQPLFWSYLAFQWYFKMRFFYLLGRGMYDTFNYYRDKWQCESKGKLWSYFNQRSEWNCSVCGDLPLFYNDVFNETTCWEAYIVNPRPVDKLVGLIKRLSFVNLSTIDLSSQYLGNEDLIAVLDALQLKANHIQTLVILGDSALPPLNKTAIQRIANFLKNSTVTDLSLQGCQIQAFDIQWLARALPYSSIQSLDLSDNNISDEGTKGVALGLLGSQVKDLDLGGNNIDDEGANGIGQVLNRSQVQFLRLRGNNIGAEGVQGLAQGLQGSQVQTLDLSGNKIGNGGAKYLAETLKTNTTLTELDLDNNEIDAEGATRLAQELPYSQVRDLDLRFNSIGAEGAKEIGQVLNRSRVHLLRLSDNNIGAEGAIGLSLGLPGSYMKILYFSNSNIGAEGAIKLGLTLPDSQIEFLDLTGNGIGPKGATGLAQGFPGSQVRTLHLEGNGINDEGAKEIGPVLNRSQVHLLDLSNNGIGDEGAKRLALGLPGSQVQSLYLSTNSIGSEGAIEMGQVLNRSQVKLLDLSPNKIGDKGAEGLAQGLPSSQVQSLVLSRNSICDEGTKEIGQVLNRSRVQYLYLGENGIGPDGAKRLAQGLPGSQVRSLDLGFNSIGDEGSRALADVMVKGFLNTLDLIDLLTPDAKKALARTKPNTPLEILFLSRNNITTQGAHALCLLLPQTYININQFHLDNNPINSSQVDPQTCFISSSAASFQSTGPYVTLYHLCQATLYYAIEGYQYITHWLTTPLSLSSAHNKARNQFLLPPDFISNTVEEISSDPPDFLSREVTINESPIINNAPSEINENKPSFTFKIISTNLAEPIMATASSSLEPTNCTSKNLFSFFNTLAKTSPLIAQPLNSNLPALSKPAETLSTTTAIGAVGAAVTGFLAVGYWAWKNIRTNNTIAAASEKAANFQSKLKCSNQHF
jgi:Ran GTPase-activating protein (RanGAP) involved in mRNA processing and transport